MNHLLKGLAGLGFAFSPIYNLPQIILSALSGVRDVTACVEYLHNPRPVSVGLLNPCFPADPGQLGWLSVVFVVVGIGLLVWAVWPFIQGEILQRNA